MAKEASPSRPDTSPKRLVFDELARLGKALASGARLELLDFLAQGPRSVDELARLSGQEVANTSHHLQVLRGARLVEVERRGTRAVYRLAADEVGLFLTRLHRLGESRLAEVERAARALAVGGPREEVDRATLVARVRRGEVTLIDVRPAEEYAAGHLPGALSVPLPELAKRLSELPPDRDVVAYCRGPYCLMALDAVAMLRKRGLGAHRLDDGVWEWKARGLPIAAGGEKAGAPVRGRQSAGARR
jgi:rhodanese-related sulfurtransferase/DNA-binding transcriptional ArsR family regulator